MFSQKEATKERVEAYVEALERELEGYEFRVQALKEGKFERLDEEQLKARVKGVKDELARVRKREPEADEPDDGEKPLDKLKVEELDALAGELGIEDYPADGKKADKVAAIQAAQDSSAHERPLDKLKVEELDALAGELGIEDYPADGKKADKVAAIQAAQDSSAHES
jgi:hypothetical protein